MTDALPIVAGNVFPTPSELLDRLRHRRWVSDGSGLDDEMLVLRNPDGPEAADYIEALRAEITELGESVKWHARRERDALQKLSASMDKDKLVELAACIECSARFPRGCSRPGCWGKYRAAALRSHAQPK